MTRIAVNALLTLPLIGAFSMFALGIVVIYRASRILNLAHGAMATLPAYATYSLVKAGLPIPIAAIAGVAIGAALGAGVERLILRPLRNESQTTQTVGTVAVLGVLIAAIARIWGTAPLAAPNIFPDGKISVGHTGLAFGDIGLALVALVVAVLSTLLFRSTSIGLAMRGAAENRTASKLMGINPNFTTTAAWVLGGGLAAAAGILLAGVTNLHPYTLSRQVLPAFVAALIGGLGNVSGALMGAVIVGMAQGIISSVGPLASQTGSAQLVLTVIALVVMAVRGKKLVGVAELGSSSGTSISKRRTVTRVWRMITVTSVTAFILAWPYLPLPDSFRGDMNLAAIYTIIGVSLVVLTGWVGQISLAQASFVGIAAFTTGLLVRKAGMPFPLNLPIACGVGAAVAALLGTVALRVRGLYLAVATLIFGWMADAYLFKSSWLVGAGGSSTITGRVLGRPGNFPSFDLTDRRSFWFVAAAGAALAIAGAANLRDSKIGRSFFAIRSSETAAASMGINVTKTKLFAFGASGLLAGLAGNLIMIDQRTATPEQFSFTASLFFLSIPVIGGITRLSGVLWAAVGFAALNEVFYRFPSLGGYLDVVASVLLLGAVMLTPQRSRSGLKRLFGALPFARKPSVHKTIEDPPQVAAASIEAGPTNLQTQDLDHSDLVRLEHVTVRFGGLVASNDVNLFVSRGEVVGLIGPNGAGKTTVFNVLSGFVEPTAGVVSLFGKDATSMPVHDRAKLGVARTFQVMQMFNDATVFDNLLVATYSHSSTGPLQHLFVTDRALKTEADARRRVDETLDLIGLRSLSGTKAGDLPFGILRMVDIGRALVTGAELLLLDEPASGLDERETDGLQELLELVRADLGRSILVVEHDVRFVTSLSDRLYVLDQGIVIASGDSDEVRNDQRVIAAYLGSDSAETRSDASAIRARALPRA